MLTNKEITDIINNIAVKHYDIDTSTKGELKMMKTCGECEHNVPFNMIIEGKRYSYRFCNRNYHYVKNNSIQLTCWLNQRWIAKRTW